MSWPRQNLGELVETQKGYAFKSTWYQDFGCPIVKVSDFTDDSIDTNSLVKIPANIADNYSRWELHEGEVVIQTVGSWPSNPASVVGKCVRVPNAANGALLNQNAVRLLPRAGLDNGYLYYSLRSPQFRGYIIGKARGSASQASITLEAIRAFKIGFPSVGIQVHIASILSAYDDLIENNRRRIQLLEQVARLLYKEWFVHLRFPGHEHTKIHNGIPQGWEKKPLNEIADITMGQSPKSEYYNEEGNGLPFHQGVTNFGTRFPTHQSYCTVNSRLAEPGNILFSVRAPVGRINITPDKIVIGRGLAGIRSKLAQQNLLFYALKSHFFKEDMIGGGAIFAAITKKDLYSVELLQAPDSTAEMFMEHVRPIDLQIENLHRTIDQLAKARDLLLPRLMNGEVAV